MSVENDEEELATCPTEHNLKRQVKHFCQYSVPARIPNGRNNVGPTYQPLPLSSSPVLTYEGETARGGMPRGQRLPPPKALHRPVPRPPLCLTAVAPARLKLDESRTQDEEEEEVQQRRGRRWCPLPARLSHPACR